MVLSALLTGLSGSVLAQAEDAPVEWAEANVEVLSDIGVIPLEAIPDDADHVTLARVSVEPGVTVESPGSYPHTWAQLDYVEEGTIASTHETDWRMWRAAGTVEDALAGTTREALAGDTVLRWNGGAAGRFENSGPEEFVMFFIGVGDSHPPEVAPAAVPGVEWHNLDWNFPGPELLAEWLSAPIAVSYERITFEPGAQLVFGADEASLLTFMWLEGGTLRTDTTGADGAAGAELRGHLSAGTAWQVKPPPSDKVRVLRNVGDEPAALIRVALAHVGDAAIETPA
jgi:hypothetical protein